MSGAAVLLGAFGALFLLLFAGFPIAFAMGIVGVAGFAAVVGWGPAIATVGQVAVDTAMNYSFSALPLFVVMGALFAFLSSFNEAVVALFIGGRDAVTLPKKMYESIRLESDPVIAVISTLLLGAVLLGVLISVFMRGRAAHAP